MSDSDEILSKTIEEAKNIFLTSHSGSWKNIVVKSGGSIVVLLVGITSELFAIRKCLERIEEIKKLEIETCQKKEQEKETG